MQRVDFWFEFASTYSYLSVMRLPDCAAKAGVDVAWRPFLLGPLFAEQGMPDSPFNIFPTKGRYMWRDMERRAQALSLTFRKPDPFPQNGLYAARVATAALGHERVVPFCQNVFTAQFGEGRTLSDPDVIADCAAKAGLPDAILAQAQTNEIKSKLRATTQDARDKGLFGAPAFTVGDELFWGDDRLEDALAWAQKHG